MFEGRRQKAEGRRKGSTNHHYKFPDRMPGRRGLLVLILNAKKWKKK